LEILGVRLAAFDRRRVSGICRIYREMNRKNP